MRILQSSFLVLLALFASSRPVAETENKDIAKFNKDYAEIQELISTGQFRKASESALAATPLAEIVFNSDLENLANYYYLVAQLQATQPWSGMVGETVPIAERAVEMMSSLHGDASEEALRAHGYMLRILTFAMRGAGNRQRIASILRVQTTKALKLVKDVETAAAADLYLALSGSAQTLSKAKKYSDAASQIFASVYGAKSKEALQTRVSSARFLGRKRQILELTSILNSIGQEENVLLLRASIHQQLAVLHLKSGEEEAAMQQNIAASEGFELLGQEKTIGAMEMLPILKADPKYPREAFTRGIEGYVILEYQVDESGRAVEPRVIEAVPRGTFDKAAIEAAKLYRYLPKIKDGLPVAVSRVRQRINFELAD